MVASKKLEYKLRVGIYIKCSSTFKLVRNFGFIHAFENIQEHTLDRVRVTERKIKRK